MIRHLLPHFELAYIRADWPLPQPTLELVQLRPRANRLHLDPTIVQILSPSSDPQFACGTLRKVPKSNALDASGNDVSAADFLIHAQ
jgi:hypothetical protein